MAAISAFASSVTSTILYCGSMSPDSSGSLLSISSRARIIVPDTGDDFFSSNFNLRTALTRLCSLALAAVADAVVVFCLALLVTDFCVFGMAFTLICLPFGVTSFLAIFAAGMASSSDIVDDDDDDDDDELDDADDAVLVNVVAVAVVGSILTIESLVSSVRSSFSMR